jgi:hypothetical protein
MFKSFEFHINSIPTIDLELGGDVALFESPSATEVSVQIEADEEILNEFKVYQQQNTIYVRQQSSRASKRFTIFENIGGNINISGGSGTVIINGRRINLDTFNGEAFSPPLVKIITPRANLEAKLSGISNIASKVKLCSTFLSLQGSVKAAIITQNLEIDSSGLSKVKAILEGGGLELNISGSSQTEIQGTWEKASVSLSGSGQINTIGSCLGDYKVNASGSGSVVHSGNVKGRIRENTSGCARVKIG